MKCMIITAVIIALSPSAFPQMKASEFKRNSIPEPTSLIKHQTTEDSANAGAKGHLPTLGSYKLFYILNTGYDFDLSSVRVRGSRKYSFSGFHMASLSKEFSLKSKYKSLFMPSRVSELYLRKYDPRVPFNQTDYLGRYKPLWKK